QEELAKTSNNLGNLLQVMHKGQEAERAYRRALEVWKKLVARFPSVPAYRRGLAYTHSDLARRLETREADDEAEQRHAAAVALRRQLAEESPDRPDYHSELGASLSNLAWLRSQKGDLAGARRLLEQALVHQAAARKAEPRNPTYRQFQSFHYDILLEV